MASILFLTQVLPYPLDAGPKIRQYHMLRHLVRNHQVTLVSFTRPDDRPEAVEHLRGICHAVHPIQMRRSLLRNVRAGIKGLITGMPMVIARDEIGEMATTLRQLTAKIAFDVVHTDQLSMAWWGQLAAEMSKHQRPHTLLDEHNAIYLLARRMADVESKGLRRFIMAREARAFARYEAAMCQEFDAVLTVTEEDKEHLLALFPPGEREWLAGKLTVVPICVDPQQVSTISHRDGEAPTILHLGTMFWPPNVGGVLWFAHKVLPLIHQRMPEARFVVVGKNPPPEVQALASDPRIQITGYVDDPTPHLEAAHAFIVPLHAGGGMRVKILDAWLWGMPTVSTSIGAEGVAYRDGENILLADDAPAFARATIRLLDDSMLNQQLRNNGRVWVETHYDWQVVYRQVDEVYAQVLGIEESRD